MPFYDYECKDCLATFEVKRSMQDSDVIELKCPDCSSTNTRRVFSIFGWKMSSSDSYVPSSGSCSTSPTGIG